MPRGDLCESAKQGRRCIDDLCRGGSETLCGFDEEWYADLVGECFDGDTYCSWCGNQVSDGGLYCSAGCEEEANPGAE